MKRKFLTVVSLLLVACMLLPFAACAKQTADSVQLSQAELIIDIGDEATLTAIVTPEKASSLLSWKSSNPAVATVDNGTVKGIAAGTAIIRASAGDKHAECTVTVNDPNAKAEVTSVTVSPSSLTLAINNSSTLTVSVLPADADKTVTWSSNRPTVASVTQEGTVTALADGIAVISATSSNGVSGQCVVTCGEGAVITGVTVSPSSVNLVVNAQYTLTGAVLPEDADQTLVWTTGNQSVATVNDQGVVTAVAKGQAVITATAADNTHFATCTVNVGDADVESFTLEPDSLTLTVGGAAQQISPIFTPADAVPKSIHYESNTPTVATVDQNGMVSPVAEGQAVITVTVDDNLTQTCQVTVNPKSDVGGGTEVTGVTVEPTEVSLAPGATQQLTPHIQPDDATNKNVSYRSTKSRVASVSRDGLITARTAGETDIIVTTEDGSHEATCHVTVVTKVTGVSLNITSLELGVAETRQLTPTVQPAAATNKTVHWSSEHDEIAEVDDNGIVKAHKAGQTRITVSTDDGNFEAYCDVTVVIRSETLFVSTVDSLLDREEPFIMGMDASAVPALEKGRASNGLYYKNFEGEVEDVFQIMKDYGITDIRIRVWNDPYDSQHRGYGGGNCDVANAVEIAKRCEKVGLGVIIDFHYSDFWADPGKQKAPKAWASYSTSKISTEIYNFTKTSLEQIMATGVHITMVQVGNEINGGLSGTNDWSSGGTVICNYINQGSKAVREVTAEQAGGPAKVAVHFANPETGGYLDFARKLNNNKVDYDVFGSSYYPQWHGTISNLADQLTKVHNSFNKQVMVLETAWAFTNDDADGYGNTSATRTTDNPGLPPISVQGQANAVRNVVQCISDLGEWGIGICYWEGTWTAISTTRSTATNGPKYTQYGCGWATTYAHSYDSSAPSSGHGGCVIDSYAFWKADGTPLESLKVFALVKSGNALPLKADTIADTEDYYTVNVGSIELPANVEVTLNDGSTVPVPAIWDVTEEQLAEYITQVGTHVITGTTRYGGTCKFTAWVMNVNLLEVGSFEDDEGVTSYGPTDNLIQASGLGPWSVDYTKSTSALQLYISNESQNGRMGTNSFHFWDSGTVHFTLSQKVDLDKLTEYGNGKYTASFEFQGDTADELDIHAYIKVTYNDGTEARTYEGTKVTAFEGWENWQRVSVDATLDLSKIASIEVGIYVHATMPEDSDGPWGNIDNCQFYSNH